MAIEFHPQPGTILICDFDGLRDPEMIKRRPVVTISPRLRNRGRLVSVVPFSTTPPFVACDYHHKLVVNPPLPAPYDEPSHWIKADMIYTVGFHRLFVPQLKKAPDGERQYDLRLISEDDLLHIRACVLRGIGLSRLTDYL